MTRGATSGMDEGIPGPEADGFESSYRSVSTVAIVGLLLGVASPLALLSPLLLALPCFSLLAAWVALRQIAGSDGGLVGRTPALVGMALALVSLSAVLTRDAVIGRRLNAQAAEAAAQWLDVVQRGDLRQAFLLTLPPRERSASASELDDETGELASGFTTFQQLADLAPLLSPSGVERTEFHRGGRVSDAGAGRLVVTQQHRVWIEGQDEPVRYSLTLHRSAPSAQRPAEWRVSTIQRVARPR